MADRKNISLVKNLRSSKPVLAKGRTTDPVGLSCRGCTGERSRNAQWGLAVYPFASSPPALTHPGSQAGNALPLPRSGGGAFPSLRTLDGCPALRLMPLRDTRPASLCENKLDTILSVGLTPRI
jgi:hypothetical protein